MLRGIELVTKDDVLVWAKSRFKSMTEAEIEELVGVAFFCGRIEVFGTLNLATEMANKMSSEGWQPKGPKYL